MAYQFITDTYKTEIEKVVSVWAMFNDEDLHIRPNPIDPRGRYLLEQMVHQSISEDLWFADMLDISVTENPLPEVETRLGFIKTYTRNAAARLQTLDQKSDDWWAEGTSFFDENRSHAWVMLRRIAHTAHHRGQQTTLLRILNRDIHSTYGPTADTGGLMQHHAPVIYPYPDANTLIEQESTTRRKQTLPRNSTNPLTERPNKN